MELLALEVLQWAIPTALGVICGALGMAISNYRKRDRALEDGMTVLLMARIHADYEHFIVLDEHMTVNDKEIHTRTFAAYEALGGNGVAKQMHEEIMAKGPWIVTD